MAWFSDIKNLTEKTGEERNAFIRRSHARSVSGGSHRAGSVSSDGMDEDDPADQVPYSANASQADMQAQQEKPPQRPQPGRFPSALIIDRNSQVPLSPSSHSSSGDRETVAAAGAVPVPSVPFDNPHQQAEAAVGQTSGASEMDDTSQKIDSGFMQQNGTSNIGNEDAHEAGVDTYRSNVHSASSAALGLDQSRGAKTVSVAQVTGGLDKEMTHQPLSESHNGVASESQLHVPGEYPARQA